jgi:hypothetical protein
MTTIAWAMMLAATFFSIAHAGDCTPPIDAYVGVWGSDGKCHPIRKSKLLANINDCTPDLKDRGNWVHGFPQSVNGQLETPLECMIPIPPTTPASPQNFQQQIDELKSEIEQLKSR